MYSFENSWQSVLTDRCFTFSFHVEFLDIGFRKGSLFLEMLPSIGLDLSVIISFKKDLYWSFPTDSGKAWGISDPISSSNAGKTSLLSMWAVNWGIASISFSFRRVECISGFSAVTPWSFSLLQSSFLKTDSLKTILRGSSVLGFCTSEINSTSAILNVPLLCCRAWLYSAAKQLD